MSAAEKREEPSVSPGGCFVAGTMVHTDKGLVPIEQIKIGDRVLSQPEQGGELAYKQVVKTLVLEDKEVWVVKFGFEFPQPDWHVTHHLYATGNHPFWVEGNPERRKRKGWIAAQKLASGDKIRLASGELACVKHVWPVVRTPVKGLGWVTTALAGWDGREADPFGTIGDEGGQIVDFRDGCNLWKYASASNKAFLAEHGHLALDRDNLEGVPYFEGFGFDTKENIANDPKIVVEPGEGPFNGLEMYDILASKNPGFTTRVYNLEVEDFHTYYVGELGVWVHNLDCGQAQGESALAVNQRGQRQLAFKENAKCL